MSLIKPVHLRCNALVEPTGIDSPKPQLSWKLEAVRPDDTNLSQSAFEIRVSSSPKMDGAKILSTGKVSSKINYGSSIDKFGLDSNETYYWQVRVWDQDDRPSEWSTPASFTSGLLKSSDWQAKWIGYDEPANLDPKAKRQLPAPRFLRREFGLSKKVKRATLFCSALGNAEFYINGKRIGNEYFMPGWTDYNKRVYYRAYDVTKNLGGENCIGAILGDGWFSGYVGYKPEREHYGKYTRVMGQINVEYADGTEEVIATDSDWKAATGPMLYSDFLIGEYYDARKELKGWDRVGFDESKWVKPDQGTMVKPMVQASPGVAVREYARVKPIEITEPKPGVYVFNMGQNFAGFVQLRTKGEEGQKIQLRHAERLNPDGTIYTTNLRTADSTDTYICADDKAFTWHPRFTFHGFQYVEVTGVKGKPSLDLIEGIALSSDTPVVGSLKTSDSMLNQIVSNAYWTQRMNFIDIPTDCPQRDERLGWTGDAQAFIRTACTVTDSQAFFNKWLVDLDDGQRPDGQYPMVAPEKVAGDDGGPAWADAGVICPWTSYQMYGDKAMLNKHYPNMKRFLEFCIKRSTPDRMPPAQFHCFGDWVSINANTPTDVIYVAYFAYSSHLLSLAAKELGYNDDATYYAKISDEVKAAFNKNFVSADGTVKGDTQCAYVLALAFDLVPDNVRPLCSAKLVGDIEKRGWTLSTGFVGTRDIMNALSSVDRRDVALKLLHQTAFPSWGFSIKNGATTIWERWDGWTPEKGFQDPGMNSFAHYAFGAVVGWMYKELGGIDNTAPAFTEILIKPLFDPKLDYVDASYESIQGPVVVKWKRSGSEISLHVEIPPNTTALVDAGTFKQRIGSGRYDFKVK